MRLSMEKSLLEQMTIEQFRQNLALLKAEEIEMPKKWVLELLNTIEALQQENERLADETIKLMKENAKNSNKKDEMVKVLKQARDALYAARVDVLTKETDELARDAVEQKVDLYIVHNVV